MILRLSTSAERLLVLGLAVLVAGFLCFFSVRVAWAAHLAASGTGYGLAHATRLERDNSGYWFLLGRYWQYNLEDADTLKAIDAYRQALAHDPHAADAYINLASAYESENDVTAAEENFLRAKKAYPVSAEVSWSVGNFFLRQGDRDEAFAEIRASVEADPSRGGEAFSRCLRVEPNIKKVLDRALPENALVYLDIIHDLSGEGRTTEALIVWDRLVGSAPSLSLREICPLVDALRGKREYAEAAGVWKQGVQLAGFGNLGDPRGSVLWDGGFESGFSDFAYAWSFPANSRGVEIQRDFSEKHSGAYSLRLTFDGKSNVNFADVCHSVPVTPLLHYQFSAWVETRELSSDEGVRFRLQSMASRSAPMLTPEMHGAQAWSKLEIPWIADEGAHEAQVCLVRLPSDQPDNHIRGTAWVDDVALLPRAAGAGSIGSARP
ncbi:MAG: tetratricopeptide repeat protein [Candidatus Acidiferrum sp.]